MFTRMPAATMVMTSEDPPKEMNGSGIPVTGSSPITAPTLMKVSAAIQATSPTPSRVPKRSGARAAARRPNQHSATSRAEHRHRADDAELLADHREDEVGVGVGQRPPLDSRPLPRPSPTRCPEPSPISDWVTW